MASSAAGARSTGVSALQMAAAAAMRRMRDAIEGWLEAEREQLVLWLPVALGTGVAAWFVLPDAARWTGFLVGAVAVATIGWALSGGRLGRVLLVGGVTMAIGCALVWWRAESVSAPVLARPAMVAFEARVERVEQLPARGLVRLVLAPVDATALPARVRVNLAEKDVPEGLKK